MLSKSSYMLLLPGRGVSPPQGSRAVLPLDSAQGLTSLAGTNDSFWSGEGDGKRLCQEANTRDLEANQWPETTRTRTILLQAFAAGVEAGPAETVFWALHGPCCVWQRWEEEGSFLQPCSNQSFKTWEPSWSFTSPFLCCTYHTTTCVLPQH